MIVWDLDFVGSAVSDASCHFPSSRPVRNCRRPQRPKGLMPGPRWSPTLTYYPSTSPAWSWANSYSWSGPGRSNKDTHCPLQFLLAASLPRKNCSESPAETWEPGGCGHLCCPWRLQGGTQDSIKGKKLVGGGGGYDLLLLEKRQRWGGWKDGLPAPVITPALPATVSQHTAHGQAQYILWE